MATGALFAAAALLCMSLARGPLLFWIGWMLFGAYVPMGLSNVAVPAVVQIAGPSARRAKSCVMRRWLSALRSSARRKRRFR